MEVQSALRSGRAGWRLLPWALVVGLAALALIGWRRAALLRLEVASCEAAARAAGASEVEPLRLGREVPEFTARSTEGEVIRVAARGQGPCLLLIYEPSCPRCEAALPTWIRLHDQLRSMGSEVSVIGLSIADSYTSVRHAREQGIPFPVVPFPSRELVAAYGIRQVPVAAVIDNDGRVFALWERPLEAGEAGDAVELLCPHCLGSATLAKPITD